MSLLLFADGCILFKLFTCLFCTKNIIMAAFCIHLLILKKVKPIEVRKDVCHFYRYLTDFELIL